LNDYFYLSSNHTIFVIVGFDHLYGNGKNFEILATDLHNRYAAIIVIIVTLQPKKLDQMWHHYDGKILKDDVKNNDDRMWPRFGNGCTVPITK